MTALRWPADAPHALPHDADSWLMWFRTPDKFVIVSDPPGYSIHKTPADPANGRAHAVYELRRDTEGGYEVLGTTHLADMAMACGESDWQRRRRQA